ncbi:hypothetical protein GMA92_08750 [Turicibacter sanguinis]|uniref:Uncharacterized protein n=1 Tax=Turicibacter sanguinis TaxID=154288 RepID=A0A9X5APM0_9FIRM|nr:hypothetical protein [Turicibacter sanguinis]QJS18985.1 transposase [Turicibacter sanguinis]
MNLIKELFPHAKILLSRFHLFQHPPRSINKTYIRLIKNIKKHAYKFKLSPPLFLKPSTLIIQSLIPLPSALNNLCAK